MIFGSQLRRLDESSDGYRLERRLTRDHGRLAPSDLDALCPDWREREAFVCGPAGLLDALTEHWEQAGGVPTRLHMERFQPIVGAGEGEHGAGGPIRFLHSDIEAESDGDTPILVAGEQAGASLPFGCRMGICHTCVGRLCSGRIRDLRSGDVHGSEGEMVRTCVNAPEGAVEIARRRARPRAPSPTSPPSRSTRSAKSSTAIHDEVFAELGDRDRRYIVSMIEMHRRLVVDRPARAAVLTREARLGRRAPPRSRWPRCSRTWRSATT